MSDLPSRLLTCNYTRMSTLCTLGFLKAPPSVRSLVLSDVSLPGGVGEDKPLTRPGSATPAAKLGAAPLLWPEELGAAAAAASPASVIVRCQGPCAHHGSFSTAHKTRHESLCADVTGCAHPTLLFWKRRVSNSGFSLVRFFVCVQRTRTVLSLARARMTAYGGNRLVNRRPLQLVVVHVAPTRHVNSVAAQ